MRNNEQEKWKKIFKINNKYFLGLGDTRTVEKIDLHPGNILLGKVVFMAPVQKVELQKVELQKVEWQKVERS